MFAISVATGANDDDNDNNENNNNNDDVYVDVFDFFFKIGNKKICMEIANGKRFIDGLTVICLRRIHLSPSDVEHLTHFVTQLPHQEVKEIDLCGCNIGDSGFNIFHQGLKEQNISIDILSLSQNNLTQLSACKVHEVTIHCKVRKLSLRDNQCIGKDPKLYLIISDPQSMLEELNISRTNAEASMATEVFSELEKSCKKEKLRVLSSNSNHITDNDIYSVVKAVQNNASLKELNLHSNPFSVSAALKIIGAMKYNNTLQYLTLPWFERQDQERIIQLAREVEAHRYCTCTIQLYCRKF